VQYVLDLLDEKYTQIMGEYTLKLQFDFNSKSLYSHMAESCSSAPPSYEKEPDC
jgi:hypothetical protein